jgi:hypothetical protein
VRRRTRQQQEEEGAERWREGGKKREQSTVTAAAAPAMLGRGFGSKATPARLLLRDERRAEAVLPSSGRSCQEEREALPLLASAAACLSSHDSQRPRHPHHLLA